MTSRQYRLAAETEAVLRRFHVDEDSRVIQPLAAAELGAGKHQFLPLQRGIRTDVHPLFFAVNFENNHHLPPFDNRTTIIG